MLMILNNELIANFLAMNYLIIIINTEFEIYVTIHFIDFVNYVFGRFFTVC